MSSRQSSMLKAVMRGRRVAADQATKVLHAAAAAIDQLAHLQQD